MNDAQVKPRAWYEERYRQCLAKYGPDDEMTQSYQRVISQMDRSFQELRWKEFTSLGTSAG